MTRPTIIFLGPDGGGEHNKDLFEPYFTVLRIEENIFRTCSFACSVENLFKILMFGYMMTKGLFEEADFL